MRVLMLLISSLFILGSVGMKAFADAPVVRTQNGDVSGVLQGAVESFKALPFAAPPVGDLRWKPPQDPANWSGVKDSSKFSHACMQKRQDGVDGSEDCLYLNVFRPKDAQGLPVIVFIHGGHNAIGSASDINPRNGVALYDGSELAQNGNVVVVTINYRLGALGFIAHPELSRESGYHRSGNYGYMDQIQALKWVSRNIAAFGGNPNNVTLFGQSSGGGAIEILMASPLTQGLFHRAIIISGQFKMKDFTEAERSGRSLSQELGCVPPDELTCMRGKNASEIVLARPGGHEHDLAASVRGPTNFLPIVDNWVLHDSPLEIIGRRNHHHVPLLIGNAANETSSIYGEESKNIQTPEQYIAKVNENYRAKAPEVLNLYPSGDNPRQTYNAISGDHWFVCPARTFVQALSISQSEFVGRFLYTHVFSGPPPLDSYGAAHGYAALFVFGSLGALSVSPTQPELTLRANFQKAWADFARSGSPGTFWNRYNATQDNYVIFDTTMSSGTQLRTSQCDYWDRDVPTRAEVPEHRDGSAAKPWVVNEGLLPLLDGQN